MSQNYELLVDSESIINEHKITNYPLQVSIEGTKIILTQLENCTIKIYKTKGNHNTNGSGFFCKFPYKNELIKALITNYHIIGEEKLFPGNIIKYSFSNNIIKRIKINSRIIFTDKDLDITIIEIKDSDGINNFLEIDEEIIQNKEDLDIYENFGIYALHYPNDKVLVSYGMTKSFNDKFFLHNCNTEKGSSGCPILLLKSNKVIGIHRGAFKNNNTKKATLIEYVISEFCQKAKIINKISKVNTNYYKNAKTEEIIPSKTQKTKMEKGDLINYTNYSMYSNNINNSNIKESFNNNNTELKSNKEKAIASENIFMNSLNNGTSIVDIMSHNHKQIIKLFHNVKIYISDYEINDCIICEKKFINNYSRIITTECGHTFHYICFKNWVYKYIMCPKCPKCNSNLLKNNDISIPMDISYIPNKIIDKEDKRDKDCNII